MAPQHSRGGGRPLLASRRARRPTGDRLLDDLGLLQADRRRVPAVRADRVRRDRADGDERPGHRRRRHGSGALSEDHALPRPRGARAVPPDVPAGVGPRPAREDRPGDRARARHRGHRSSSCTRPTAGNRTIAAGWYETLPNVAAERGCRVAVENMFPCGCAVEAWRGSTRARSRWRTWRVPGRHPGHEPPRRSGPGSRRGRHPARRPAGPRPPFEQRRQGLGLAPAPGRGRPGPRPVPRGARGTQVPRGRSRSRSTCAATSTTTRPCAASCPATESSARPGSRSPPDPTRSRPE